jgi:hypothetical protein
MTLATTYPPTEEELEAALRCFNCEIKILARSYVTTAYDSTRLVKWSARSMHSVWAMNRKII